MLVLPRHGWLRGNEETGCTTLLCCVLVLGMNGGGLYQHASGVHCVVCVYVCNIVKQGHRHAAVLKA